MKEILQMMQVITNMKCPKCGSIWCSLLTMLLPTDPQVICNDCYYAGTMAEFADESIIIDGASGMDTHDTK